MQSVYNFHLRIKKMVTIRISFSKKKKIPVIKNSLDFESISIMVLFIVYRFYKYCNHMDLF